MTLTTQTPTPPPVDPAVLGGVSPSAWDAVAGPHLYSRARWLDLCADHGGGRPGAAVTGPRDAPAAVVPFTELTAPPPAPYRWNDLLAGFGLPRLLPDGLIGSSPWTSAAIRSR